MSVRSILLLMVLSLVVSIVVSLPAASRILPAGNSAPVAAQSTEAGPKEPQQASNAVYLPIVVKQQPLVLSLLHNNDGESSLLPITYQADDTELQVGGVSAFKAVMDREIAEARSNGQAVISVYSGDAFLASATLQCSLEDSAGPFYDAIAQRQMPYTAHSIGNHEFDYNPDTLERFIRAFESNEELTQPFLGANLDFSGEPGFNDLTDEDGIILTPVTDGRVVGQSAIISDTQTGAVFGLVGVSPFYLKTISSPRNVEVTTDDLESTVALIQEQVDRLYNDYDVNKIIVVSHLQDIDEDINAVPLLQRVDLIVAGGGDEMLTNKAVPEAQQLLPGESAEIEGDYPVVAQDKDGRTVYIVTTAGNYKYVGRLDVQFNDSGEVVQVISSESYPRRVIPDTSANSAAIDALNVEDAVVPDAGIVSSVDTPIQACRDELSEPLVRTQVLLDTSRGGSRGKETNTGNLVTDAYIAAYDDLAEANELPARGDSNPVIAIQNGGGIRQNAGDQLPAGGAPGTISRLNTFDVLAFYNTMTVVQGVTPADLKEIFERSASTPGGGQFLQVSGVVVRFDLSRTAQVVETDGTITTPGERVTEITLSNGTKIVENGQVVSGAPDVSIITNSFTADGGDNYPALARNSNKTLILDSNGSLLTYEQTWVDYLLSFPTSGTPALPTIPDESRYRNNVNERIFITGEEG